jgi:hypothetical protein
MRKVLSFVLVLSLVLGSFGMAFAATPALSDVAGQDCEDAVNVLTELGVVQGYPDGSYKPDKVVTRAEMAVIVVSALGLEDYAVGKAKFSDMAGHWSNGYVAYATSLGIIAGYPDGTFKPDKTVSYDEAATMLVAALGYNADSLVGTWPANFVSKAKTLGILDGIKAGAAGAVRGDIAIMTYQTLDQNIGKTNKDGDFNYDTVNPDTMLVRLGAEAYNNDKSFVVTDTIAKNESIINLFPYIGAYIKAYQNSDEEIIAVKEVKSTFLTGSVKDNGKFKAAGVEYAINDAKYLGKDATNAVTFDNGVAGVGKNTLVKGDGTVTIAVDLSGKTVKEIYSIAKWTVKGNDFFSSDDASDINDDHKLFGYKFAENDNEDIDTNSFALLGATSLKDIAKDSVVYVYANSSKEIARIEVSKEVATGEVTRITSGGDYTIGGNVYRFADQIDKDSITPKTGDSVKVYLDYAGDIYKCVKEKGDADNYAVVLDTADGVTGFAGKEAKINLFLADGTEKAFAVDEEEVDNSILGTDKVWKDVAGGPQFKTAQTTAQAIVIKYSVDKNGVIDEIVIPKVSATLTKNLTEKGYYDGYAINSDAVMFTIDKIAIPTKKADDYGITTLSKVLDSKNVVAKYVLDSGRIVAMLLESDVVAGDDVFGVAIDAAENNSDAGYEITLLVDGVEKTYNAKTTPYGKVDTSAERDALFLLSFNTAGDISDVTAKTGTIKSVTPTGIFTVSGRVVTISDVTKLSVNTPVLKDNGSITLDSDAVVYVWNVNDKCYEVGSIRDIANATVSVEFFDVFDTDSVYDIVLIHE